MRKAILLYNPLSGRRCERRTSDINLSQKILQNAGVQVSAAPTRGPAEAAEQVQQAVQNGCDTVFACGGDGTIHDVLQGIVGTNAALGVIPLGTANALAHDLAIPLSVPRAARAALTASPRRFSVGKIEFQDFSGNQSSRYFTVAAGVGLDAHLFHNLNPAVKKRHGMVAYYMKAWHLWMTYKMPFFIVESGGCNVNATRRDEVTELLAVRIANFGGILRRLAPGASLTRPDLRAVLCKTASRTSYLRYVMQGWWGKRSSIPGIELQYSNFLHCRPLEVVPQSWANSRRNIYVEADGELLGTLPASISVVRDAYDLLIPQGYKG
jgi:diacylglycerol kinase (ATP)